jgi:hypothetical protein
MPPKRVFQKEHIYHEEDTKLVLRRGNGNGLEFWFAKDRGYSPRIEVFSHVPNIKVGGLEFQSAPTITVHRKTGEIDIRESLRQVSINGNPVSNSNVSATVRLRAGQYRFLYIGKAGTNDIEMARERPPGTVWPEPEFAADMPRMSVEAQGNVGQRLALHQSRKLWSQINVIRLLVHNGERVRHLSLDVMQQILEKSERSLGLVCAGSNPMQHPAMHAKPKAKEEEIRMDRISNSSGAVPDPTSKAIATCSAALPSSDTEPAVTNASPAVWLAQEMAKWKAPRRKEGAEMKDALIEACKTGGCEGIAMATKVGRSMGKSLDDEEIDIVIRLAGIEADYFQKEKSLLD